MDRCLGINANVNATTVGKQQRQEKGLHLTPTTTRKNKRQFQSKHI